MNNTKITETSKSWDINQIIDSLRFVFSLPGYGVRGTAVMINNELGDNSIFTTYVAKYDADSDVYVMEYNKPRKLNHIFEGTYLEEVYRDVEQQFISRGMEMGRARLTTVGPLQALAYHRDYDGFRFHIPVITNNSAVFMSDCVTGNMPKCGVLYEYNTSAMHTAINLSTTEERVHLVFDRKHDRASY